MVEVEAQQEKEDENPGVGAEASAKKSTQERSMEIMLRQGMQTMQQQILDQQGAGKRASSEERREDE